MKTILKSSFVLATFVAITGLLATSAEGTDHARIWVTVTGGSIGDFVATPHSLNTSGFTNFAVNITVRRDGTASGEFICAVPGIVVLGAEATTGHVNHDGSVTVSGMEYGYDTTIPGGYTDCPFSVTFRAGGVGVGGFDFSDCVFPAGMYDTEIIRVGSIQISH